MTSVMSATASIMPSSETAADGLAEATVSTLQTEQEDPFWIRLRTEAEEALRDEPELSYLLHCTVLAPDVNSFDEAVAKTIAYRMIARKCTSGGTAPTTMTQEPSSFCPNALHGILLDAIKSPETELGHTMAEAIREDAITVCNRDPACDTLLEVVLFFKGYAALVAHRAARRRWNQQQKISSKKRSMVALFLQSQASQVFAVDIHPACQIGKGVLFDHGTGIVIGETAVLGDGCTLLHGVTLGGTGKETGDRHPKIGSNVLIGAGAKVLGNVKVGDNAKIGAGSIVLRPIPSGATAVGAPAKIIGRVKEQNPGSEVDETLSNVILRKPKRNSSKSSSATTATTATETETSGSDNPEQQQHQQEPLKKQQPKNKPKDDTDKTSSISEPVSRTKHPSFSSDSYRTDSTMSDTLSDSDGDSDLNASSSSSSFLANTSPICPFRDIDNEALKAPKGTVTHMVLGKCWYMQPGVTCSAIGEIFFDLDTKVKGYVPLKEFQKRGKALIQKYTEMDPEWAMTVVTNFCTERDRRHSTATKTEPQKSATIKEDSAKRS